MSRDGEGNFDDDIAPGILMSIVDQLIETVHSKLAESSLFWGEAYVMPAIDILVTLGRAYPETVQFTFAEQPVTQWKETYIRIFKEQSEVPIENRFQADRLAVIVETFSNLEELVARFQKDIDGFED